MVLEQRSQRTLLVAAASQAADERAAREGFWIALEADERLSDLGWSVNGTDVATGIIAWEHPSAPWSVQWSSRDPQVFSLRGAGVHEQRTLSDLLFSIVYERW